MPSYHIDVKNVSEVKSVCNRIKADFLSDRVMMVLKDYYDGSGVEIMDEPDLRGLIETEISICLNELKG